MAKLLPVVKELPAQRTAFVARAMGAAGSAAMMGSDVARAVVVDEAQLQSDATRAAIDAGRNVVAELARREDAYHGTLRALSGLFSTSPMMFEPEAHQLRMLQTYAGGWALLRHDTLLYAYQMGAECDAEDLTAPYGWVEPYPEIYTELRTMVRQFETRLRDAGIPTGEVATDDLDGAFSIGAKTEALVGFLDKMIRWSTMELAGEVFSPEERTELAMVGGAAEYVVLTLADAYELGNGNDDMAVVADVFTFHGQALEVAVGHPELIYALIPSPTGWVLGRGSVLAYREFFVPTTGRMTDQEWRDRVLASTDLEAGTRPAWLSPIQEATVGVVTLPADGKEQTRCGYYGGAYEL